jgi:hypothetical protein
MIKSQTVRSNLNELGYTPAEIRANVVEAVATAAKVALAATDTSTTDMDIDKEPENDE